jgi:hypothetical protein
MFLWYFVLKLQSPPIKNATTLPNLRKSRIFFYVKFSMYVTNERSLFSIKLIKVKIFSDHPPM